MTGSLRAGVMTGEQWVFEERTTDPATTLEGERWLRTDLAPETNQIATLRVDVGSSVVDVPVFATGTSESGVNEALRVRVGGQDGYIPITSPGDATFNNLRMQHAGSTLAYHDRVAPGSAIPDSAIHHYPADEGAGTTLVDNIGSADITLSQDNWETDSVFGGGTAPDFDGTDDDATKSHDLTVRAWTMRVIMDSINSGSNTMLLSTDGSEDDPRLFYRDSDDSWVFDAGSAQATVGEAIADATDNERVIMAGYDGTNVQLYVYDSSDTAVGSDSTSASFTTDGSTLYLGQQGGSNSLWYDGNLDQIFEHDQWLDSTQRSDLLNNHY